MMNGRIVEEIFAGPTVIVHSEDVEQRRFAGAGRPHHRNEFAFRDFDIDVAQNVKEFSFRQRKTRSRIVKSNHGCLLGA